MSKRNAEEIIQSVVSDVLIDKLLVHQPQITQSRAVIKMFRDFHSFMRILLLNNYATIIIRSVNREDHDEEIAFMVKRNVKIR